MNSKKIKESRILILDDEPVNIAVLEELFLLHNYTNVASYTNPIEAIECYKDGDFDIVMLDINMPIYSGFDVLDKFAEHNSIISKKDIPPVIVLTVANDDATKIQALTGGASDFLTKPFSNEEVLSRVNNLLDMFLSKKALNIINDNLEYEVEQRTKQLAVSQREAILCLGHAAEYRDMDTAKHTIRVAWYSQLLGEKLGLSKNELDILFQAAPMHDVGKIGIPDRVLLKPGKFDSEEWEIMKTHCEVGAKILQNNTSPLMIAAREIALCHHEKWDGSGYPRQLVGEDIPINARIVLMADIFDALTIERPYKKAWALDDTIKYIISQSGTFFQPKLVEIFEQLIPQFVDVMQEFRD